MQPTATAFQALCDPLQLSHRHFASKYNYSLGISQTHCNCTMYTLQPAATLSQTLCKQIQLPSELFYNPSCFATALQTLCNTQGHSTQKVQLFSIADEYQDLYQVHFETHSNKLSSVQDEIRTKTTVPSTVATDNSVNSSLTTKSTREIELEKMIASLKNQCFQLKTNRDNGGSRGRGRNGRGRGRGQFNQRGRGEKGIKDCREYCETIDDGRTMKFYDNKNMCHTHGWDIADSHTSLTCNYPDKNHEFDATADDPKGACELYKRLSHKT